MSISYVQDQRWIGHYNISNNGKLKIKFKKPLKYQWSTEFWLNLKHFPPNASNKLLEGPITIKYNKQYLFINGTQVRYIPEEWFQLLIVSGSENSLGQDSVNAYINGKLVNNAISAPSIISSIVFSNEKLRKNKLERGSMLGLSRFYSKSLNKYHIMNNYHSEASRFGLELPDQKTISTKYGLVKTIPKVDKKNNDNEYMNSSEIHQLSKLFATLNLPKKINKKCNSAPKLKVKKVKKVKTPDNGQIVMSLLNTNPEMFMNMLNTGKIPQNTCKDKKISKEETDNLFADPIRVSLLVSYLKQNPRSFITILESNILTNNQLSLLKTSFENNDSDGFVDYDKNLEQALLLLNAKQNNSVFEEPQIHMDSSSMIFEEPQIHLPFQVQQHQPHLQQIQVPQTDNTKSIADSLTQISKMMNYDRQKTEISQKVNKKKAVLDNINKLNESSLKGHQKLRQLEQILAKQNELLGLVVSQKSGKCVGAIKKNGKIKKTCKNKCKCRNKCKCGAVNDASPYNIILNTKKYQINMKNILNQHQLQNQTVQQLVILSQQDNSKLRLIGQCVNREYKTIAVIVVFNKENHYLPTVLSTPYPGLPILAMIDSNQSQESESEQLKEEETESCPSGKCKPGYNATEPEVAKKGWLSHLSSNEGESEEDTSSLFAYTSLFK
jgi:hypothetical protein